MRLRSPPSDNTGASCGKNFPTRTALLEFLHPTPLPSSPIVLEDSSISVLFCGSTRHRIHHDSPDLRFSPNKDSASFSRVKESTPVGVLSSLCGPLRGLCAHDIGTQQQHSSLVLIIDRDLHELWIRPLLLIRPLRSWSEKESFRDDCLAARKVRSGGPANHRPFQSYTTQLQKRAGPRMQPSFAFSAEKK